MSRKCLLFLIIYYQIGHSFNFNLNGITKLEVIDIFSTFKKKVLYSLKIVLIEIDTSEIINYRLRRQFFKVGKIFSRIFVYLNV